MHRVLTCAPYDRADWMLENCLVVLFAVILVASYRHMLEQRATEERADHAPRAGN